MSTTIHTLPDMVADTSIKVTESTKSALTTVSDTVSHSGLVRNYLSPFWSGLCARYRALPWQAQYTLLCFAALGAVPTGCFLGFMGLVTLGCMIVGGIGFSVVEGGFALFASAFLMPALGVSLFMSAGLGLLVFVAWVCYKLTLLMIGFMVGNPKQEIEDSTEHIVRNAQQTQRRGHETLKGAAHQAKERVTTAAGGGGAGAGSTIG